MRPHNENDTRKTNESVGYPRSRNSVSKDEVLSQFDHLMKLRAAARETRRSNVPRGHSVLPSVGSIRPAVSGPEPPGRLISNLALDKQARRGRDSAGDLSPILQRSDDLRDDEDVIAKDLLEKVYFDEELGHVAVKPEHKIHQRVNTDIFPYYPADSQLRAREYWLAAAVIDCADYHQTASLLESGAIQYAVHACSNEPTHEVRMLLITLLRLAASCYTHVHYLLSVQRDIFILVLDCMRVNRARPAAMDSVARWNQISDSRAWKSFLPIAFGAHTRPTAAQYENMTPPEKQAYEDHVKVIWNKYGSIFQDPHTYVRKLPDHLAPFVRTFFLSDLAIEIFIDLAPHGFFDAFAGSVVEVRWDRCFNSYLEKSPFNINIIKLYRLLHQSPNTVAAYLARPFAIYKTCYSYLSWGLRTILDNEFYRNAASPASWNRPKTHVPLEFCIACAETLRTFLDFPALGASASFREVRAFMRRQSVINELLRFVLAMPNIVETKKDKELELLYAAVWSIIHSTSYTFPFMLSLLVDFACDETVPDCLGLQSAMFVAACVSFARIPLRRSEVLGVYKRLLRSAEASSDEPSLVKRRRQELLFRMAVILCPEHFDVDREDKAAILRTIAEESVEPNVDDSGIMSTIALFSAYDFKTELQDKPT